MEGRKEIDKQALTLEVLKDILLMENVKMKIKTHLPEKNPNNKILCELCMWLQRHRTKGRKGKAGK